MKEYLYNFFCFIFIKLVPQTIAALYFPQPGDFVHTMGDAHVYVNHIGPLKEQVNIGASIKKKELKWKPLKGGHLNLY